MDPSQWMAFGRSATGDSTDPQISSVMQVLPHPLAKTRRGLTQYDVALIQLDAPLQFGQSVRHICVADKPPTQGQMCVVAGWTDNHVEGECTHYSKLYFFGRLPRTPRPQPLKKSFSRENEPFK